jgi:hypothetical protein
MLCKKSFITAVVLALVVTFSPLPVYADLPVDNLRVDQSGAATWGWGYNLTTKQFTGPCISYSPANKYYAGDTNASEYYNFADNTSVITSNSNLSVSASLKVMVGGTYQLDNKTSVAAGTETSSYNQSLLANYYSYKQPEFIRIEQVAFRPDIVTVLKDQGSKGQFKQQCGDGFVLGVQSGREFIGTASVVNQTLKNWTDFANKTGLSASYGPVTATAGVDIGKQMQQSFGSNNIVVKVFSTGSNIPSPTSAGELQNYYRNFKNSSGPEKQAKLIVVPYQMVPNYPWENPLQGTTKEDYIGMMVVGLWELKAAMRDAKFILDPTTVNMFALGRNQTLKNQRIAYIKQLRDIWQKEYDLLLKSAQKCDQNFTDQCKQLGEFYDRDRNIAAQWLAVLPERYLSDCFQSIILKGDQVPGLGTIKNKFMMGTDKDPPNFGTPVVGDSETAGNPSRVVAEMTFRPDQRQLKADIRVAKIEWHKDYRYKMPLKGHGSKNDRSTWGMTVQDVVVCDLNSPGACDQNLSGVNLNYCEWAWSYGGVYFPYISVPEAPPELSRYGFNQKVAHGYVDGLSGKHPRGQIHFGNGEGALTYITCEVDKGGKDNNLTCKDIGFRNAKLYLISSQDSEADRWVKPTVPVQMPAALASFDGGAAITSANKAQFTPLTASLSGAQKTKLNTINAKRTQTISMFKTKPLILPAHQTNVIQQRLKIAPGAKSLQTPVK